MNYKDISLIAILLSFLMMSFILIMASFFGCGRSPRRQVQIVETKPNYCYWYDARLDREFVYDCKDKWHKKPYNDNRWKLRKKRNECFWFNSWNGRSYSYWCS